MTDSKQNNSNSTERFVAEFDDKFKISVDDYKDAVVLQGSFLKETWKRLRVNPFFIIPCFFIVFFLVCAFFPGIFSSLDPNRCIIQDSRIPFFTDGHLFGTTLQGCDVYSRLIHGARPSLIIGVSATLLSTIIGVVYGAVSGFFGGRIDAVMSRILEIFISIPTFVAFVVILQMLKSVPGIGKLIIVFVIFGWMSAARLMRGNVLAVKNQEFITASKALGISKTKIMFKHIIPNSIAPVIATSTMLVGTFIIMEATLSFLGLGLVGESSWGVDIANATAVMLDTPGMLFLPCLMLVIASLTFILLGDAISDAIDPKGRR